MVPVIKLLYFSSKLTFSFLLSEFGAGALQPILPHYLFILDKALLLIRTVGLDRGDRSCFFLFPGFGVIPQEVPYHQCFFTHCSNSRSFPKPNLLCSFSNILKPASLFPTSLWTSEFQPYGVPFLHFNNSDIFSLFSPFVPMTVGAVVASCSCYLRDNLHFSFTLFVI